MYGKGLVLLPSLVSGNFVGTFITAWLLL